ncbi:MAG: DUF975 family protein [Cellulosilyticaceae bacterium]
MFNRVGAKEAAKDMLKGNWARVGGVFLIVMAIMFFTNMIPWLGGIAYILIIGPFSLAMAIISLKVSDRTKVDVEDAFIGFKNFSSAIGLFWWVALWTWLWSLLLIIPGIIKGYSYRLAFYVLAENPEIGVREALNESKRLTQGHKMDLFIMDLSFIGWGMLASLTFGIGYFWLVPYMQVTMANAYRQIRG